MSDDSVAHIAGRLVDAHHSGHLFATAAAVAPAGVADAYRIQDVVLAALSPGQRTHAWKVSPPNPAHGVTASPIPAQCLHAAPATLHAAGREVLGVEIEIAFRIGRDLVARADPYADEEVFAAIDAAVVAIELCATRLADWQHAGALWRLADFQSHGALVLGSTLARWRGLDFGAQVAQLRVNGSLRAETRGSHPLRDPSQLLPWMARHVCSRGGDLRHGDIVTTGSWTGLQPVAAGDRIEARFPGIGAAALVLAT